MIRKKLKSLMYLTLCLALLSGCSNKEENHDITDSNNQAESVIKLDAPVNTVTEEVSTAVDATQPDAEKEVLDTKEEVVDTNTGSQPAEEVKPITLTEEEFYSKDIVIPNDKPFEITMTLGSVNLTTVINQSTSDLYYNIADNEFMYVDGVNYVLDKNNPLKYKGNNIMMDNSSDTGSMNINIGTSVEEPLSILDTLKINNIDVVSNIIVINGDILYDGSTVPTVVKVDYNTHEFISLTISQDSIYVSFSMLDNWNGLPDLNYKEVDMETIEKKVEESFMMIMAGAFALAFSEENILAGFDGPNPDENGYYRYKITIDGLNEDTKAYASDFIWGTYNYEYDLNSTYYDSNSSYYIWVGRELSDEELNSMEGETEKYLESIQIVLR